MGECLLADFSSERNALIEPDQGRISELVEGPVASDSLAQLLRGGSLVQDIVGNLEGEPDLLAEDLEMLTLDGVASSEDSADAATCPDESPGFSGMDRLQVGLIASTLLGLDIEHFAADKSERTRSMGESPDASGDLTGIVAATSKDLETEGKEGVSGKNRHGFAELDMARWSPAAQIVVVDGGEVVVDEAEAMNQLNCATGIEGRVFGSSRSEATRHGERGSKALARGQRAVTHGSMEFGRGLDFAWQKLA